jgi:apolipoprotein N-acyltransferase
LIRADNLAPRPLTRLGDLLALAAGAALPLAFAPFGVYPMAVLSVATLFVLLHRASAARGFLRGWLYGLGQFGVGVYWIAISVNVFGGTPLALAALLMLLFVAGMAVYPALLGWYAGRFVAQGAIRTMLMLPAGWVVLEWLRGWFLSGFPWLSLGYSQIDAPPGAYAPLLGVHGVSAVVAISAGLIAWLAIRGSTAIFRRADRPAFDRAARSRTAILLPLLALTALWGAAPTLNTLSWAQSAGEPLRVALVQGNISQAVKWELDYRMPTLERYMALTRDHWDSDLIVWPETAVPVFYNQVADNFIVRLRDEARRHGAEMLIGIPVINEKSDEYYNAMLALGAKEGFYRKRHLVPFGEFVPFKQWIGGLLQFMRVPMSDFSKGPMDQTLLQVRGHPVGISICYEDAFGDEVRHGLPAAELLVNVSNDAWFGDSLAPHQHLEIARMRARETGRYLLRATNTGISAVIDEHGGIVARSSQFREDVLTATVRPLTGATPYVRYGDVPLIAVCALIMIFPWRKRVTTDL